MTSDVGAAASGGSFFPPAVVPALRIPRPTSAQEPRLTLAQRVAVIPGMSRDDLRIAGPATMAATLQSLWAAMANRPVQELVAGETHENGTPRIGSQVAVWLIGRISEAYGRRTLVKLSQVKSIEALRSIGGLTQLLTAAISADMEGKLV